MTEFTTLSRYSQWPSGVPLPVSHSLIMITSTGSGVWTNGRIAARDLCANRWETSTPSSFTDGMGVNGGEALVEDPSLTGATLFVKINDHWYKTALTPV